MEERPGPVEQRIAKLGVPLGRFPRRARCEQDVDLLEQRRCRGARLGCGSDKLLIRVKGDREALLDELAGVGVQPLTEAVVLEGIGAGGLEGLDALVDLREALERRWQGHLHHRGAVVGELSGGDLPSLPGSTVRRGPTTASDTIRCGARRKAEGDVRAPSRGDWPTGAPRRRRRAQRVRWCPASR